ncbi:hypothetical protein RhiirA1_460244 [Rhizophagus irregularis]|uniref:Uncharacterized protein n=1 Tax=Rhizophagus irregularis TaxID=588596 RepID=A0A2N0RRW3_9GLOM|nr:hypothetical protein RhiirA1_460244 [Rhizophagus irregularis]
MKYIKQIKVFRDNVEFESEIRMFSRFAAKDSNNEIDAATERDKKRKELDKDNEYTSTPTCTRTKMNIVSEAQGEEDTVSPEFIDDPTGNVTSKKVDALATDLKHRYRITLIEVSLYKPRVCKEVEVRSAVFPFTLYMRVFELASNYLAMQELYMETNGVKEYFTKTFKDIEN